MYVYSCVEVDNKGSSYMYIVV